MQVEIRDGGGSCIEEVGDIGSGLKFGRVYEEVVGRRLMMRIMRELIELGKRGGIGEDHGCRRLEKGVGSRSKILLF